MEWSVCVIPGDRRQEHLVRHLKEAGYSVVSLTAPGEKRAVVLPVGASDDGRYIRELGGGDILFGGATPDARDMAREKGVRVVDYQAMEDFALRNAAITAECALAVAIEHTEGTIQGADILVLGYGRIGSMLSRRLRALGACVDAASACKIERALAQADGVRALPLDVEEALRNHYALIVNTIPAPVLPPKLLDILPPGTPVIDLATAPGASPGDERVIRAGGLPGRYAPDAAARAVALCVTETLRAQEAQSRAANK